MQMNYNVMTARLGQMESDRLEVNKNQLYVTLTIDDLVYLRRDTIIGSSWFSQANKRTRIFSDCIYTGQNVLMCKYNRLHFVALCELLRSLNRKHECLCSRVTRKSLGHVYKRFKTSRI